MRIDLFLHRIRLLKSRTQAQALVEQGTTRVDGRRVAKASDQVAVGSIVAVAVRDEVKIVRVLALPARRGPPAEACAAYEVIDEASAST